MGSYVYRVTNISKSIQSFQGYALAPEAWVATHVLSSGVITGYKNGTLALYPDILDIDVFKVTNISPYIISLSDLQMRPNESGWIEGLDVTILTAYQRGEIALDPDPFSVPVYDGKGTTASPVGGGSGVDTNIVSATSGENSTLMIGQPVYSYQNGLIVMRAQGNNITTKSVWGLIADASVPPRAVCNVMLGGVLTATVQEWNAATGFGGGLVMDAPYYLSTSSPGRITPFGPPSIPGENLWAIQIGYAISSTQLKVEIQQSIKL